MAEFIQPIMAYQKKQHEISVSISAKAMKNRDEISGA
jgi:hypothetical protein|tara:strand:+ start:128 stop:238 length:111 start_codon:yes stop_codon:yes gene_type:complete